MNRLPLVLQAHPADPPPANLHAPALHVRHADLKRVDDSPYRSQCPACKQGILLVGRDRHTLLLLQGDNCIACGQRVYYDDIEDLREREKACSIARNDQLKRKHTTT